MPELLPAPILFCSPVRRAADPKPVTPFNHRSRPAILLPEPRTFSVEQVAKDPATLDYGITLIPVQDGNVAVRFGDTETGWTGYASAAHGIAFVSAVIGKIAAEREEVARAAKAADETPAPGLEWGGSFEVSDRTRRRPAAHGGSTGNDW